MSFHSTRHFAHLPILLTLAILWLCTGLAASATAQELEHVRLALHWRPQAQFAGYFVAQEKGFYEENGIDLLILGGGPDTIPALQLRSFRADFATTFLHTALRHRSQGTELVNVGQVIQQSALMIVARKADGVASLEDLSGGRLGTWGNDLDILPETLLKRKKLDMEIVRQSPSFELFMRGGVDAAIAMWYNEYHTLMSYGLQADDMAVFFFSEMGLNIPEDGVYCMASTWERKPDLARRLVEATAKGWEYAFAHPDEALEIVLERMRQSRVRANKSHQQWMLDRMRDIILPDGRKHVDTTLRREDFESTLSILMDSSIIETPVSYEDFCKGPAR